MVFPGFVSHVAPTSRRGALQGEALALGTWRVRLRPAANGAGRPRGSAELELFVVGVGEKSPGKTIGKWWFNGG